ncbi:hypothetical protein DA075_10065 [Methylobacterium currus]|uniref:Uncharacterized protein n=1 Tax=Methylobacterium currus TaxID=2051553 RepID=A0A2R4WI72_9HYPH|nr:hypothetical protein [Methylobacterium currus]AWB21217.1 hypothetical protein DA075_10065 [Methylobacterium currus]
MPNAPRISRRHGNRTVLTSEAVAFVALVLGILGLWAVAMAGCLSKRASQPNPLNGSVRVLSEVAR